MKKDYDKEYFEYLKKRSLLERFLRKYLYKELFKEIEGSTLDVGCGIGEFIENIPNSVGIDINPYCVKYCNQKGLNVIKNSATKIRFKNEHFNTIICVHLLEHLKRPEDAIKEMYRKLKPNGKLIIVVPTECGYKRDKTHKTFLFKENIRELLEKNNFKIKRMYYYPFASKFMRERLRINVLRVIAIKRAKR